MTMEIQPVILRYDYSAELMYRDPVLFIPDLQCSPGMIACYQRIGQHSEASMSYYWDTRVNAERPEMALAGEELLAEYRAICEMHGQRMVVVKRDREAFRRARWGWYSKEIQVRKAQEFRHGI